LHIVDRCTRVGDVFFFGDRIVTWHLPGKYGTLAGAEAELFIASVASIYDMMLQEIVEGMDQWDFGIPAFDELKWHQRLAILIEVSEALLREDIPAPELTCVREATVGAICENVRHQLDIEIDLSNDNEGPKEDWEYYWRRLVLVHCIEEGGLLDDEKPIDETCGDHARWHGLAEDGLSSGLLWDDDWLVDHFDDMAPAKAAILKDQFDIPQDYYSAIAPAPKLPDVLSLMERMDVLLASIPIFARCFPVGFRPNIRTIAEKVED